MLKKKFLNVFVRFKKSKMVKVAVKCGPIDAWYENYNNGTAKWMGEGRKAILSI
jgi:hypothetical protein